MSFFELSTTVIAPDFVAASPSPPTVVTVNANVPAFFGVPEILINPFSILVVMPSGNPSALTLEQLANYRSPSDRYRIQIREKPT